MDPEDTHAICGNTTTSAELHRKTWRLCRAALATARRPFRLSGCLLKTTRVVVDVAADRRGDFDLGWRRRSPTGYALGVRVGIHTGAATADIGRGGAEARPALGDVPNIAARLQGLAARKSAPSARAHARCRSTLSSRAFRPSAAQRHQHIDRRLSGGASRLLRDSYHGTRTGPRWVEKGSSNH